MIVTPVVYDKYLGDTTDFDFSVGDYVTVSTFQGYSNWGVIPKGVVTQVSCGYGYYTKVYQVRWADGYEFSYGSTDLQPYPVFDEVSIDNNALVANIAVAKAKTALAGAINFLTSGLTSEPEKKTMTTPDTSNTPNAPTGTYTFETKLDGVTHVGFTSANPGAVGWVVLRKKQRGRPTYFGVTCAVPADAVAFDGVLHPLAVNVLNAGG